MQADHSVELGQDDPALELPWVAEDGSSRYLDLRAQPELLLELPEAVCNRELAEFLTALNGPHSAFLTAKCDTWFSRELSPEEDIFGASVKFGSYVDLCFLDPAQRLALVSHEDFAARICRLLNAAPEVGASAELAVRRCYYHSAETATRVVAESDVEKREALQSDEGMYITLYVSGFGDEEDEARLRWSIGLKLVQNAIVQVLAHPQPAS